MLHNFYVMHQQQCQHPALDMAVGHPVMGRGHMLGIRSPQPIQAAAAAQQQEQRAAQHYQHAAEESEVSSSSDED
jgi:hypothetical protein